ncbi:MAG: TonB-dependent receptor [Bacteroidetes bacterium]|nr:TonB-dependent receptor [Bacteroidota bacterium]
MVGIKINIRFLVFALWGSCVYAQKLDTLRLNEIPIISSRIQKSTENFYSIKIDSVLRSQFLNYNMAQLLLQQNAGLVKAYGPGNIASLGIRGSTAQQTAVVWNGININSPTLGQTDISLLPVGFFNNISLQKGALSSYWGSGAMAGVLNIQSAAPPIKGIIAQASTSYSSFKNSVQWASIQYGSDKISSTTKLLGNFSQNRYPYYSNTDSSQIKTTQQHAQMQQLGFLEDINYKINTHQQIGAHIWWQNTNRQVPYTTSALQQNATQTDKTLRTMIDWNLQHQKVSANAKAAWFNEAIIYNNTTSNIYSNNRFNTFALDADAQYKINTQWVINLATSNMMSWAYSPNFTSQKQLLKNALFENISRQCKNHFFKINFYARQELFNTQTFMPTAGLTTNMRVLSWLIWSMNMGTVYRYPTLNDLYWTPGGNPNLKPEQGYSGETSLQVHKQYRYFSISETATLFSRSIHNNIMWLPGRNGIWSPTNILQVWSRGMETNTELKYKNKNWRIQVQALSNYILSTTLPKNNTQYLQMPYVPMYSGSASFCIEYKNILFRSAYTYTGYRYLSSDNYSYLKPYSLIDIRLAKTFFIQKLMLHIFVEVNNLLNQNYQSMMQYGMPLRNYGAGLIVQYHYQSKNK